MPAMDVFSMRLSLRDSLALGRLRVKMAGFLKFDNEMNADLAMLENRARSFRPAGPQLQALPSLTADNPRLAWGTWPEDSQWRPRKTK